MLKIQHTNVESHQASNTTCYLGYQNNTLNAFKGFTIIWYLNHVQGIRYKKSVKHYKLLTECLITIVLKQNDKASEHKSVLSNAKRYTWA